MTFHQYGTLKYMLTHSLNLDNAGAFSMATFGSIIKRGWVKRNKDSLELTQKGLEAYKSYCNADANFRKFDTGLSDHVRHMLRLGRISVMRKVG